MTFDQARRLYLGAGGNPHHSESEWNDVHEEIEAIVAAKSDRAAGEVIQWWNCWDGRDTATAFARRVRRAHS